MQNTGNVSILGVFTIYFFTAIFGYPRKHLQDRVCVRARREHRRRASADLQSGGSSGRAGPRGCASRQTGSALLQLLFPGKPFPWLRHVSMVLCLLRVVKLLGTLVPNTPGRLQHRWSDVSQEDPSFLFHNISDRKLSGTSLLTLKHIIGVNT